MTDWKHPMTLRECMEAEESAYVVQLKQQRDELLDALKDAKERMLVSYMHEGEGINRQRRITFMDLDVVTAAINKAEASK